MLKTDSNSNRWQFRIPQQTIQYSNTPPSRIILIRTTLIKILQVRSMSHILLYTNCAIPRKLPIKLTTRAKIPLSIVRPTVCPVAPQTFEPTENKRVIQKDFPTPSQFRTVHQGHHHRKQQCGEIDRSHPHGPSRAVGGDIYYKFLQCYNELSPVYWFYINTLSVHRNNITLIVVHPFLAMLLVPQNANLIHNLIT